MSATAGIELDEDGPYVNLHRASGHTQLASDELVAVAL